MAFDEYLHFKQGDAHDEWKKVCSEEGLGSPGGFLRRKHDAPYSEPTAFRGTMKPSQLENQQQWSDPQQFPKQASSSHAATCPERSSRHRTINADPKTMLLGRASLDTQNSAAAYMPRLAG